MKQYSESASIAERIRLLMGEQSATGFARRLGILPDSVADYLQGRIPDQSTLIRMAELCDVSSEWLLRGTNHHAGQLPDFKQALPESAARAVPPPVNLILNHPTLAAVRSVVNSHLLVKIIRHEIQQWARPNAIHGTDALTDIAKASVRHAETLLLPRRGYVNATGIIIHTGWGNAPLHALARERVAAAMGASPTGAVEALPRMETCATLLRALTGAEAATVTTMNAASLLLVAGALAAGREIIVAARDLVEISQGARIADILQAAGARVVSVGSANCVYLADYARAVTAQTAMLMRIRVSNMATSGYIAHVAGAALADLARKHDIIYVDNLGGGSLVDLAEQGLPECPTLQQGVQDGATLVLASADKIIGGPQAGIIVGNKECVDRLSHHVLARTCRPAKLTLAALEGSLAVYVAGRGWQEMPTLRMLKTSQEQLAKRAAAIAAAVSATGMASNILADTTECGGAVLPGISLPTWTVQVKHPRLTEDQLYDLLLTRGVIARRGEGKVILDLRSILPEEDSSLIRAIVDDPALPA
jgi:L-seryl-tRNA(Ser) seleniumtransferase